MSKVGRLPGSSFMQILMSLAMWGETPGETVSRSPSVAICNITRAGYRQGCEAAHPHAGLHGGEVCEGFLPGGQLPQQHRVAPHVGRPAVDLSRALLECLGGDPAANISFGILHLEWLKYS